MARYRVQVDELARVLGANPPAPGQTVEIELEPVYGQPSTHPYTVRRSEPLREPVTEMVKNGLSNRAIAEELNDRCLYGPNGGLWHSSSIKRLRARLGV